MTCRPEYAIPSELREEIAHQGLEFAAGLIRRVIYGAIWIERQH